MQVNNRGRRLLGGAMKLSSIVLMKKRRFGKEDFMFERVVRLGCAIAFLFSIGIATVLRAHHHEPQPGQAHHQRMEGHEHQQGQQGQQGMIVAGKKGEVAFAVATKVGDLVLRPGVYRFQHRVEDGRHYVRFTELGTRGIRETIGEVECAIEPASEEFSRTAVFSVDEGLMKRLTRIEVKGENVVHVF